MRTEVKASKGESKLTTGKEEAKLTADLEQDLNKLEQRIALDVCEFQLSLPFQTVGGNVKRKVPIVN